MRKKSVVTPGRNDVALASLDAIESTIAVLNEVGEIMFTNRAWKMFARQNRLPNGGAPNHVNVGANYLAVADRSVGSSPDEAAKAAKGIRLVLSGKILRFSTVYPCHSPKKKRWFRMTVSPLVVTGRLLALVVHEDVTELYKAWEFGHTGRRQLA